MPRAKQTDLVPFDNGLLREAIERDGRSRRAIAKAVARRLKSYSFKSQNLDSMCNKGRRCGASVRRALAQELGVPEVLLVLGPLPQGGTPGQAEVFLEWTRLVIDLKVWRRSPNAHAALMDLPDSFGLAMIHLSEHGAPLKAAAPPKAAPLWFIRASVEQQTAWNEWLRRWIEAEGRDTVRRTVVKHAELIRARFVGAERYWKPKRARKGQAP